jgi:hypothetical protein
MQEDWGVPWFQVTGCGRQTCSTNQPTKTLDTKHGKYWLLEGMTIWCQMFWQKQRTEHVIVASMLCGIVC